MSVYKKDTRNRRGLLKWISRLQINCWFWWDVKLTPLAGSKIKKVDNKQAISVLNQHAPVRIQLKHAKFALRVHKKTSGFLDVEKRFHYASRKGLAPLIYIARGKLFQVINQSRWTNAKLENSLTSLRKQHFQAIASFMRRPIS